MRPALLAFALLCAGAGYAHAQEGALAAAAPAPSPEARAALWCGAAFVIAGDQARAAGDDAKATDEQAKGKAAFAKAAAELIANGMSIEQFRALSESIAAEVATPFRETSHSRAECLALLPAEPAQ
jgi:hypothetical protein